MPDAQQKGAVRDRAEEDAARSQIAGDVLEHDAGLGDGLEGVVHAELHRDGVEGSLERRRIEVIRYRVLYYGSRSPRTKPSKKRRHTVKQSIATNRAGNRLLADSSDHRPAACSTDTSAISVHL